MKRRFIKTVSAALIFLRMFVAPANTRGQTVTVESVPVAAPAPAPAAVAAEAPIQVARWDVLLNESGMDAFDQLDRRAVETTSKMYQASVYNASALRAAVVAAKSLGGMEGSNQSMAMSQNMQGQYFMHQSLYFGYYGNQDKKAGINGNANGNESLAAIPDNTAAVHLKVDFASIRIQIHEPGTSWTEVPDKPSLAYDGNLAVGEAVAFRGSLKSPTGTQNYYHLIVWEAFRAEPRYMQNYQTVQSPDRWCQLGPEGVRTAADVATVWSTRARHETSQVAPKWERKLDDGKTLRLTGITRSDKWLYCWWDADGQPIASTNSISLSNYSQQQPPCWFSVEIRGSTDEWKKQGPTGKGGNEYSQRGSGEFQSKNIFTANAKGEAVVGVPVGDWEQVGQVTKNGTVKVGTATYRLRELNNSGDNQFYAYFQQERVRGAAPADSNTDLITITAVDGDNNEIDPNYIQQVIGENYGMSTPNFNGMPMAKVKLFHVWKRKRQWVRFTDFAQQPVDPPPAQVTPAELHAVIGVREEQQQHEREQAVARQLETMKAKHAEWQAIAADVKTPRGALRAMMTAAAAGDRATVRKRLVATHPDAGPTLDVMAQYITSAQSAWAKASTRFGETAIAALAVVDNQPTGLMDMEAQLISMPWQDAADGGMTAREMNIVKGEGDEFYLDMSKPLQQAKEQEEMLKHIRPMIERMEAANQILDSDPAMTLAQFREALTKAASVKKTPR